MAVLDRLAIRGIRNFGVDAEDEQVCLDFFPFFIRFFVIVLCPFDFNKIL